MCVRVGVGGMQLANVEDVPCMEQVKGGGPWRCEFGGGGQLVDVLCTEQVRRGRGGGKHGDEGRGEAG